MLRTWLTVSLLLLATFDSWAAPCPAPMDDIALHMLPRWEDDPVAGTFGIQNLFASQPSGVLAPSGPNLSVCLNCHQPAISNAWSRFKPCGACHSRNPDAVLVNAGIRPYPGWLDFSTPDLLVRNSYYLPGHTKAEAALVRATDGSMPPGKDGPGLCDEFQQLLKTWIDEGYPQ